jgi:hypothetical protein
MTNIISIVNKTNNIINKILINKLLQLSIFTLALLILIQLPILHQTVSTGTIHFSIWNSIQMDISEHQFQTLYFIINSILH